jgi:hypothetical protein
MRFAGTILVASRFVVTPLQGDCGVRLETADMSDEDKYVWSIRCGARLLHISHYGAHGFAIFV